ncbi:MAG: low molecular weight protein-tyrosine-phosphatase [Ferruginibacter sp.]
MKILMVCLGNICRSPLAEGILQHKANAAGLDWQVDSAGTNHYHVGEAPHHLSQKVATLHGIDISSQKARSFTCGDFQAYDKIYVMAEDVMQDIHRACRKDFNGKKISYFLEELYPGEKREVPDPWYGEEPGYHEVYSLLEKACDAIIQKYTAAKSINI